MQSTQVKDRKHAPRIDAYGTVRIPEAEYKARVIEYAPGQIAIFRELAPTMPVLLSIAPESDIQIRGSLMKTTFIVDNEEVELLFQKAGCGCETPRNLRGGRNALITGAGLDVA